jgi:hypothetical protein
LRSTRPGGSGSGWAGSGTASPRSAEGAQSSSLPCTVRW